MWSRLNRWRRSPNFFGDAVILAFLVIQGLDGTFTYMGVKIWGPGIEANVLLRSMINFSGLTVGLVSAKLFAAACGITLHLLCGWFGHIVIVALTAFYMAAAIVPWTMTFMGWI